MKYINRWEDVIKPGVYTFINPFSYLMVKNFNIRLSRFTAIGLDAISSTQLVRLIKKIPVNRVSFDFTSIAPDYFTHLNINQAKLAICGSTDENLKKVISKINKQYPNIEICYHRNGYFLSNHLREKCLKDIQKSEPDFILIGMGGGIQDIFSLELFGLLNKASIVTCGGFIHQYASSDMYYPRIFDKTNTRFLYRMYDEPKLISRYFIKYPLGIACLAYDLIYAREFKD